MAEQINNGGPAFPVVGTHEQVLEIGMNLRDYFAAKAMHQFLHGAVIPVGYDASKDFASLAGRAYEMADAMLKAREGGAA